MQAAGLQTASVDEVINALKALEGDKVYGDPPQLQGLQAKALEKVQSLELDLRKKLDKTSDSLFLNGAQDVPPGAKALIDQYFKKIGGGGK